LISASYVGYLRYLAGKHFPSDVIVGAFMGSVAGYLVPYFHKKSRNPNSNAPFYQARVHQITIFFAI
jgi:membrane-associated phospholipid phosphatase